MLTEAPESLFWYWISERHSIYLRRAAGLPKPWTDDPILQQYKFTNPFRENDRGTVWLRENFLEPHRIPDETWSELVKIETMQHGRLSHYSKSEWLSLLAFNIAWYRMFNWWGTGRLLGWQTDWDPAAVIETLTQASLRGEQVFTGAHIVYSPPGRPKIDAIVDVCSALYDLTVTQRELVIDPPHHRSFVEACRAYRSLERAFYWLQSVYCVGGFMAYEMVTDMRHTRLLEDATDIMTWANMGPGAKRGLTRLGLPARNQDEGCESMRGLLSRANTQLPVNHPAADWPTPEMRDIEHSLCEFDKYCRVKFGEGKPRSMYPGRKND